MMAQEAKHHEIAAAYANDRNQQLGRNRSQRPITKPADARLEISAEKKRITITGEITLSTSAVSVIDLPPRLTVNSTLSLGLRACA